MLLKQNAEAVLKFLFTVLQQVGKDHNTKMGILSCLSSWIRSGNISQESIQSCSLVELSFDSVKSQDSFDVGVDMVCEVILASARSPRNHSLIQSIVPYLNELLPFLKQNLEDPDITRGLCRIYVEAAEGYADIISQDLSSFHSVLEGLLLCASSEDLEIIKITINAWFMITEEIIGDEKTKLRIGFLPIYQALVGLILQKMQYPDDLSSFSAQEKDEFRDFRHDIGDVLKDCVKVLGQDVALQAPYNLLRTIFETQLSSPTSIRWQEVEAPLFSLRTMCREVSLNESKYIPEIMGMLPNLPDHPKIKYAAILVIGRYAQWTNEHSEMIAYQLDFVSKGFQQSDEETTIAAAHTFRDLCKYCSKHLLPYIEQLQPFYTNSLPLVQERDRKEMSEAISHLICAVPVDQLGQALHLFCMPVAQRIHSLVEQNIPSNDIERITELNGNRH
jgi:transportin-3